MIEFLKTVACDGKKYEAGGVVPREAVLADYLASCLRLGYAREVAVEQPAEVPAQKKK